MAFGLTASVEGNGDSSGATTGAIDTTGADLLVAAVVSYAASAAPALSDSEGNTWTPLTAGDDGTCRVRIYYCAAPSVGAAHTFSAAGAASYAALGVSAWSGASPSPGDQENGSTFPNTSASSAGEVTPSIDGSLVVAAWGFSAPSAPASPSIDGGFSALGSLANVSGASFGILHGYLTQTTAAAANPQASWGVESTGAARIASFKPAGGGGGANVPAIAHHYRQQRSR